VSVWLHVIGIGEEGLHGLGRAARAALDSADVLVGGERHLAMLPVDDRERLSWPSPLQDLIGQIQARRDRRVCVLATGDPCNFGVAVTLSRHIPAAQMCVIPSVSAFSLACARMGWDRNSIDTLTLHGRPLALLRAYLQPAARLLVLSEDRATPTAVARLLVAEGYADSCVTVLEHMGGEREARRSATAGQLAKEVDSGDFTDLNTLAVECVSGPDATRLSRLPGLPDDAFAHDGQLTKRVVRAATLAALAPLPGELLWDVGAGCGSVAIEWMRTHPRNSAVAIERRADRVALCDQNAQALGVPGLRIEQSEAPAGLRGLPAPHAVFIGGGIATDGLFEQCWSALRPCGRLVANAVTLEGEQALFDLYQRYGASHKDADKPSASDSMGGDLSRIAVSRATRLGAFHGLRAAMPVSQLTLTKPPESESAAGLGDSR
jgi:precorrin-6Y C5,15-methyltransferase (decarboxylating)